MRKILLAMFGPRELVNIFQTIFPALQPELLVRDKLVECVCNCILIMGIDKDAIVENLEKRSCKYQK